MFFGELNEEDQKWEEINPNDIEMLGHIIDR